MTFDQHAAVSALQQLCFKVAGRIGLPAGVGVPTFSFESAFEQEGELGRVSGWVYVWAKFRSDSLIDVCYVGKAGKTLKARCKEHINGFKGSSKSKKGVLNGQRARQFLLEDQDHTILLYARNSPKGRVLDEEGVSMCEAEERAMIMKMRRLGAALWNS